MIAAGTFRTSGTCLLLIALLSLPACVIRPFGSWVSLGPKEIIQSIYDGPNSGRATVIAVNPFNQDDVWLGTATGGVWHSTNINDPLYEWTLQSATASSQSIGALLLEDCSAQRCDTVWVGTGENNLRRDTYYGTGLFKLIWDASTGDYSMDVVGATEKRFKFGSIIDIKRLGGALYLAVSKGKSASASTAIVTAPPPRDGYGIHRSDDEGLSWELVAASPDGALPSDMEIQAGSLLVGFYGKGVFRLTAGDTWCPLGLGVTVPPACPPVSAVLPDPAAVAIDHVEVAVAPSNPDVIYAAFGR